MIYYTIRYNDFYSIDTKSRETPCNTLKRVNKQLFLSSTTTETARVIAAVTGVQGIMDRFDFKLDDQQDSKKRGKNIENTLVLPTTQRLQGSVQSMPTRLGDKTNLTV